MTAQRYQPGRAHERMAIGACPECGQAPQMHSDDQRFWIPRQVDCDLTKRGVEERITQYEADLATENEEVP